MGWMIWLTTYPYNCYYQLKREAEKELVVGCTRDTSFGISRNLKSYLKTCVLLSQRCPGRPSTFPLISLCLSFPTVPSSWKHFEGTYTRADTPLDWRCINKMQLHNKLKSTNRCLKPRTFEITGEYMVDHVVCCPVLLFQCQRRNINQSGSTAAALLYADTSCDLASFLSVGLENKFLVWL